MSSPATPSAQAKPPAPPPKPDITATFISAAIEESAYLPPEFIVTVPEVPAVKGVAQEQPRLAIEFCTDPMFKPGVRSSPADPLRYFNTALGINETAAGGLRSGPLILQPRRGGPNVDAAKGPAGTLRLRYILDRRVWDEFLKKDRANRLYYRVYASAGTQVTYSWTERIPERAGPPFIMVLRGKAIAPSLALPKTAALKLDSQARLVPPKSSVSTQPYPLQGVNLSGMQHRQFNWGQPIAGPRKLTCSGPVVAGKGDPPAATHCPLTSTRWTEAAGITKDLFAQLKQMRCNVVRVTFNQDWVLNGLTPAPSENVAAMSNEEYLRDLDQIIAWAADCGIYVILAMHTMRVILKANKFFDRIYEPHLPDALTVTCWNLLSRRYREVPSVIFDLCNEPHAVENDKDRHCYTGIVPSQPSGWTELWHDWVRQLEEGLHGKEIGLPERLIMVSGMHGAGRSASLRQMPVRKLADPNAKPNSVSATSSPPQGEALPNIIYSAHTYCDYEDPKQNRPGGDSLAHWLAVGADSSPPERAPATYPVFLGEWGPAKSAIAAQGSWVRPDQVKRINALKAQLSSGKIGATAYLVGWAAWAFGDDPLLDKREKRDIRCCGSDLSKAVPHSFAFIAPSPGGNQRVLTDWGKVVASQLKPPPP